MINLAKEETNYLLRLLNGQARWWIRDKLIEKIEDDKREKEERSQCNHEYGKFKGERVCCIHCGGFGEGMGYSWELIKKVNPEKYKMPIFEEHDLFDKKI